MRLLELLGLSAPTEEEQVDSIKLEGPFLPEDYGLRVRPRYVDLLRKTLARCNLTIGRDLLVMTADYELSSRDNSRIELGLNHHIHQFELSFRNPLEYEILAIDHFIILNPNDAKTLKEYLNYHLPTEDELKRIFP